MTPTTGVSVIISSQLEKSIVVLIPINYQVILLKFSSSHRALNVIHVNAPIGDKMIPQKRPQYKSASTLCHKKRIRN